MALLEESYPPTCDRSTGSEMFSALRKGRHEDKEQGTSGFGVRATTQHVGGACGRHRGRGQPLISS